MNLDRLFRPKNVVVYGGKWSDFVVEQCLKLGFSGNLWRVHPNREGCFREHSELPDIPDSAFLGINREQTLSVLRDLSHQGLGGAVVFASGFGEVEDGLSLRDELEQIPSDLPFIGPNCYGFINFFDQVALWPDQVVGQVIERGVAIISQSGTISITLMAQRRSLPVGYVISVGNQQRLAAEDLIRYCAQDDRVSAIGLYMEGIKDISNFIDAVEEARQLKKPIALIKAGRSEKGKQVALTHTGAMTGSEELHDALFERLGIARCEDLSTLVETLKLLHCCGPLQSNRVSMMSASGGDVALIADNINGHDLVLEPPSDGVKAKLSPLVGERVLIDNPLDFQTATWFDPPRLRKMFKTMLGAGYSLTSLMLDPPDEIESDTESFDSVIELFLEVAEGFASQAGLLSSLPESLSRRIREKALKAEVVPLQGLPEAIRSMNHASLIGKNWKQGLQTKLLISDDFSSSKKMLTEFQAKSMFRDAGLPVPYGKLISAEEAPMAAESMNYPLVLKASSRELFHKTDQGGVALGLYSQEEVANAVAEMRGTSDSFLLEEMVTDTVAELLLGLHYDPQFGFSIIIGSGGIFAELLDDSVTVLFPMNESMILQALEKLKIYRVLQGWRGNPKGDLEALLKTVQAFIEFAENHHQNVLNAEINPLAIRPEGKGVILLDALIQIKEN